MFNHYSYTGEGLGDSSNILSYSKLLRTCFLLKDKLLPNVPILVRISTGGLQWRGTSGAKHE